MLPTTDKNQKCQTPGKKNFSFTYYYNLNRAKWPETEPGNKKSSKSFSDYLSLHIPATEQTKKSIGHKLMTSMPKGATLVNTARKEVIDEAGVIQAMTEREDLKYITDIAPEAAAEMSEKFGKRFFATPKKMGAETAEANINAGLAAANQIVDFFKTGNTRFQVNK